MADLGIDSRDPSVLAGPWPWLKRRIESLLTRPPLYVPVGDLWRGLHLMPVWQTRVQVAVLAERTARRVAEDMASESRS